VKQDSFANIPLNQITVVENYRKTFNEAGLKSLAQSIKKNNVLQPILVRPVDDGYAIIAGERRFRASQMAGLVTIPAVVRDIKGEDVLRQQIVENVQRENVHYMELAHAIKRLRDEGDYDMDEIARIIGKDKNLCYSLLSLTKMHSEAQRLCSNDWISMRVAFHIAKLTDEEQQSKAANDLARTGGKDLRITENGAKSCIRDTFGDGSRRMRKQRVGMFGSKSDYASNWKYFLVRFTGDQFEHFKKIVRERTETEVLSEAVDLVMRRDEDDRAAALTKDIVDSAPKQRKSAVKVGTHADPENMKFQNA
jgi:ParB/RepB/Spo0J family partition protein